LQRIDPIAMKLHHEIVVRVSVATVALPIVAALLWRGECACAAMFGLAAGIAAYEYYRLTDVRHARVRWLGIAAAVALPTLPLVIVDAWPAAALGILATTSMSVWTVLLIRGPRPEVARWTGLVAGGVLYIATGLASLAVLRARPEDCRSRFLRRWFGETDPPRCGRCDRCISAAHARAERVTAIATHP
jgi:hypothetical protein